MRPLVTGNWKMNGLGASLAEIEAVVTAVSADPPEAEVVICPPATLLARAVELACGHIAIGGQDCHAASVGAFTGDVSAEMLKDAGAAYVIVGHSERRQSHQETDEIVAAKAAGALRAGLTPIICIGETEAERDAGRTRAIVSRQLRGSMPEQAAGRAIAIAYEPVWAIGTDRTPTLSEIADTHAHIRSELGALLGTAGRAVRILYGGSVKPSNAREILAAGEVCGALVGGASLKAADFCAIFRAVPKKR